MNTAQDSKREYSQDLYHKEQLENARLAAPIKFAGKSLETKKADNYEPQGGENKGQIRGENNIISNKYNLHDLANNAKQVAALAKPGGVVSLLKEINILRDLPFVAAGGAAILKDIADNVDMILIILPTIFSILCSIFILMMLLLVGNNGKRKAASKWIQKLLVLIGGGIIDSILPFLPMETLTVAVIFVLELMERKNSRNGDELQMEEAKNEIY